MADWSWEEEEREGALIGRLVVTGQLSEPQIEDIGSEMLELLDRSHGKILLDLQDVEFVCSALLAKLIKLRNKCEAGKTDLRICSVPPLIMNVIEIARLDTILKIHDSVDEALRAD